MIELENWIKEGELASVCNRASLEPVIINVTGWGHSVAPCVCQCPK